MSISVKATALEFDRAAMRVALDNGRKIGVPLAWFPRLARATPAQRANWRIGYSGNGLHWDELDEDISVEGLLAGWGDATIPTARILANAVLAPVGAAADKLPDRALTACLAIRGPFYRPGGTMAVGRAANVWTDAEIRPRDLANDETRRRYAQRIHAKSGGDGHAGIEAERALLPTLFSSALFPAPPGAEALRPAGFVAWSALYKAAPADGGDPDAALREAQFDGCAAMLRHELDSFRPTRMVLATGRDWADPFLDALGVADDASLRGYDHVERAGRLRCPESRTRVVVAQPTERDSARWKGWVEEVKRAFAA